MLRDCVKIASILLFSAGMIAGAAETPSPEKENKNANVQQNDCPPPPPPARPGFGHPGPKKHGPEHPGHFLARLTPEEHAELREFRKNGDEEGFRRKIRELRRKYASPVDLKVEDLSVRYQKAKTQEEKAAVKKELREAVSAQFAARSEFTRRQIEKAEKNLAKLKKIYENSQKNSDKIIDRITEDMCLTPEQRREMRKRRMPPKQGQNKSQTPPKPQTQSQSK